MQPKDTEERRRAIDRVNRAYADEDYDRYERLIERYCQKFGFDGDYSLFEDACTDARMFKTEMTKPEKLLCTIRWCSEFTTTTAMQP